MRNKLQLHVSKTGQIERVILNGKEYTRNTTFVQEQMTIDGDTTPLAPECRIIAMKLRFANRSSIQEFDQKEFMLDDLIERSVSYLLDIFVVYVRFIGEVEYITE